VASLSGRGQRWQMILPWVLITLVMYCIGQAVQMRPLQSASIVNKKDHSHVGRSFGHVWRWACGLPYAEAGRQSRPPVAFPACISTCASQHWKPGHCPPFHAPIRPWRRPIIQQHPTRAGGDSPARRLGSIGHCAPPAASWPFCDVSGTPPPTMSTDQRGCHIGREQHRGPARDRPPPFAPTVAIQLRSCR